MSLATLLNEKMWIPLQDVTRSLRKWDLSMSSQTSRLLKPSFERHLFCSGHVVLLLIPTAQLARCTQLSRSCSVPPRRSSRTGNLARCLPANGHSFLIHGMHLLRSPKDLRPMLGFLSLSHKEIFGHISKHLRNVCRYRVL